MTKHTIHIVTVLQDLMQMDLSKYNVCLVFNFRYIIPDELVARYQFFNIHYSLLPKFRGPNPLRAALLVGERYTGISIHKVISEVDAGPLAYQEKVRIPEGLNYKELFDYLTNMLLNRWDETIHLLSQGKVPLIPQEGIATYTSLKCCSNRFVIEDIRRYTAIEIYNRVRAYNPDPGVWLRGYIDHNERYIVLRRVAPVLDIKIAPGQVIYQKASRRLIVGTAYGGIAILLGGIVGKKLLSAEQWGSLKGRLSLLK